MVKTLRNLINVFGEIYTIRKTIHYMIKRQVEANIPIPHGEFRIIAFSENDNEPMPHLAMVHEPFDRDQPVLVRIHSECLTGDIFGSQRCDCGEQLDRALDMISEMGGVVLYLRQEGRGIGLINKLKAYNLQDEGLNTVDANIHLGFEADQRTYDTAVEILKDLGIETIHLLTNNPEKIGALENTEITVASRVPIIIEPGKNNHKYLTTKQEIMGHLYKL